MTVPRKETQPPTGRLFRAPEACGSKPSAASHGGRAHGEFLLDENCRFHTTTEGYRRRVTNSRGTLRTKEHDFSSRVTAHTSVHAKRGIRTVHGLPSDSARLLGQPAEPLRNTHIVARSWASNVVSFFLPKTPLVRPGSSAVSKRRSQRVVTPENQPGRYKSEHGHGGGGVRRVPLGRRGTLVEAAA